MEFWTSPKHQRADPPLTQNEEASPRDALCTGVEGGAHDSNPNDKPPSAQLLQSMMK